MEVTLKAYCMNTAPRPFCGMYLPEHDLLVAMIVLRQSRKSYCIEKNNHVLIKNTKIDDVAVFQSLHRNVFDIRQCDDDVVVSLKENFNLCSVSVD